MSYNPAIPAASDTPSVSQGQMQTNFNLANTYFSTDHIAFNAASDQGEHQQVTLNSPIADPGLADPKCSLYLKTVGLDSELFFEKFDNTAAANLVQQMTNLPVATAAGAGWNSRGITTPWGIIINWGTYNTVGTSVAITFAVTFVGTPIVTLGREDNVVPTTKYVSYRSGTVTNLGFTAVGSSAGFAGSYIAIGV